MERQSSRWTTGRRHLGWVGALLLASVLTMVLAPPASADLEDPVLPPELREIADLRPVRVGWVRPVVPVQVQVDGDEVVGGWGYDLWTIMAVRAGITVEHVLFDSAGEEVAALKAGTIDVAGALGPRPDLVGWADAVPPLAWDRQVFISLPRGADGLPADLAGQKISASEGTPLEALIHEKFPRATFVPTGRSMIDALDALETGELDAYLSLLSVVGPPIRDRGLEVAAGPSESLPALSLGPWAPKGSPYLEIAALARAEVPDVAISSITQRWTGFDLGPPSDEEGVSRWALITFGSALGALVLVGGFAMVLRRRVRTATEQLSKANESLEERVMLRTAELHLMNASLARFSRSIAHDLRNPLTVIAGMTGLLRKHDLDDDARARILESIERSTMKLDEMISTMLTDAAQSGTDVVELDGAAYEGWLRGAVAAEVVASGADLRVSVPTGHIDVDVSLLLKSSINLVGNALKYSVNPDGMRIEVTLARAGDRWILTVDDNGPGLGGTGSVSALFERGVRGHDDDRGQGWGLADIRDLVTAAGGSISAGASTLGGAYFSVVLPRTIYQQVDGVHLGDGGGVVPAV